MYFCRFEPIGCSSMSKVRQGKLGILSRYIQIVSRLEVQDEAILLLSFLVSSSQLGFSILLRHESALMLSHSDIIPAPPHSA
jgi:hypothetical protein